MGRGCRSEYCTETFFICVRTLTGNLYWQLWACFTLVYCLTINYSTRGAIHICALVKLFFGTGSEQCSMLRYKPEIKEVNSAHSDHLEFCMHWTYSTFWGKKRYVSDTELHSTVHPLTSARGKGKNFLPFKTLSEMLHHFWEKWSGVTHSTQGCFWINFRGKCFSSHRHTYNTPFKMEDGGRKLMFFLAAETKKHCGSHALFLPLLTSLPSILSSSTDPHRHPF